VSADGAAYPRLFEPLRIGPIVLKNRILNSAHQTGFASAGQYTPQLLSYHREVAAGGAAAIISQATCVTDEYVDLWNVDESIVGQYQQVMAMASEYGAHYLAELLHPGRQGTYTGTGASLHHAPSPVPLRDHGNHWRVPHELDAAAIPPIIAAFGAAARRCREGGLSGVVLHFAHGNLVEQFMSPATNRRRDEWGGSLENRLRLAREILLAVRQGAGDGLAIGVRITGAGLDRGEPGELDMLEIAGTIDSWQLADFFDVTMGHYSDGLNAARNIPNMSFRPGLWARYGKAMREVVSVPVTLVGRINHPWLAEELIAGGSCDAVVMARALIADPYLPQKASAGLTDQIRACVGAMNCTNHLHRGRSIRCIQNPVVGREATWGGDLEPARVSRQVLVVGGGPAGLECARVAARRGHQVTLLEQAAALGGQVRVASAAPGRAELAQITDWLSRQCLASGVDVRLETTATPELVTALRPDAVVIATGSAMPPLDLDTSLPMADAVAAIAGHQDLGGHVVVFDEFGDWQGVSAAHTLAARGADVELVTPVAYPGAALEDSNWRTSYEQLAALGVSFHPVAEIAAVRGDDVVLRHGFGRAERVIAGVSAIVGVRFPAAADSLFRQLAGIQPELHLAGDAMSPRGIEEAIYEGHRIGRAL
jgi:2,4-dienoyl-CoA reductase-like NADH-dependent reductase (Old Yellow Enzyme family)/thioredoxin reductase